jgi:hypothetical protein
VAEFINGTLDRSYILGLRVEGQWAKDQVLGTFELADQVWFIRDGHGSNRLLADAQGRPVELFDYAAYGEPIYMVAARPAHALRHGHHGRCAIPCLGTHTDFHGEIAVGTGMIREMRSGGGCG